MNNESVEEVLAEEEPLDAGPGQLLRQKREALGLSVQEIADRLHITMHYVRALEADAHEKLPSDVFIKGYLRSYSSLLGLDPGIVVNMHNEYTNQRESAKLDSGTRLRRRRRRNKNLPWIVVSGVAFVVMAILLWYFSTASSEPAQDTGSRPATTGVLVAHAENTASANIAEIATTREVPSTPQISSAIVPERLITIDGGGDDTVQIRFAGESMVQVDDANDAQLYRDVRVAGDVLRISGTAPFNVLLGDASQSELSLNGAAIDFKSSIRIDNSARLTIGL